MVFLSDIRSLFDILIGMCAERVSIFPAIDLAPSGARVLLCPCRLAEGDVSADAGMQNTPPRPVYQAGAVCFRPGSAQCCSVETGIMSTQCRLRR